MFPFPTPFGKTPVERNAQRDERVATATSQAISALESMIAELRVLQTGMADESWLDRQNPGSSYHRAEYVGRQFTEAAHGLRRFYEASTLATTTAGGYEDEV